VKLHNPLEQRRSGILLHPTSLPGPWVAGDMSHSAYRFVEFLAAAGQSVWQLLPLGPTHGDGSPYQCLSTHAGNPLLISLDWLIDKGWLEEDLWQHAEPTVEWRRLTLQRGCENALARCDEKTVADFDRFCRGQAFWLNDYVNYVVLKELHHGASWTEWPADLRLRDKNAVEKTLQPHADLVRVRKFEQYLFFTQWRSLRKYAHQHGVYIFGDLPIFVSGDSADVWAHRQLFSVDTEGNSEVVAGVPPDAFSELGQRWGNPLYDWSALRRDGFSWWKDRLRTHFSLYDLVRIDHFRGLESYWEIPAKSPTAVDGRWVDAPGDALLTEVKATFTEMPLIAEDLGIITDEVHALRRRYSMPGMKVLQFAFDGDTGNHHLPHNHTPDMVVYTGTHDNDTTLSWYQSADESERHRVRAYLECADQDVPWCVIRSAMMSAANTAILPLQDVLSLGAGHRMNTPGTVEGNWCWRFQWELLSDEVAGRLRELTSRYDRLSDGAPVESFQKENRWPLVERRRA
jgi:4-alpha-glucanotransferase